MLIGLKAEWHEGQGNKIKIRPELYKKGCVTDIDDGMKVSFAFFCEIYIYIFKYCAYKIFYILSYQVFGVFPVIALLNNFAVYVLFFILQVKCFFQILNISCVL